MRQHDLTLTAGQAIVRYLSRQHTVRDGRRQRLIRGMFGIFGHGNVTGLGAALEEAGDSLRYYQARNEQAMVHTAVAFARKSLRLSTLACTSSIGPGATNMVTGAATATINRIPVLLLPGEVYASRRQGNVLQQIEHPISRDVTANDCFRPVSRFFDRILRPEQLIDSLPQAMRVLSDPEAAGAVTLALAQDVGAEAGRFPERLFAESEWFIERRIPNRESVRRATALLHSARRPLIIAGGGVHYSEAQEELQAFAERFQLPVSETFAGKGAIPSSFDLLLGGVGVEGTPAANRIARHADVVLCIGTRLSDFITGSRALFQADDVQFIGLNVSRYDATKLGGVSLVADAKVAIELLGRELEPLGSNPSGRNEYASEVRRELAAWQGSLQEAIRLEDSGSLSQGQVIHILNQEMAPGDTVITAAGAPPGDLLKIWDATGGRHCQIEFGNSCMGHEVPGGLGVRLAQPTGQVVVYTGDGSYLMSPTEIITATQEGIKVTLIIIDNGGYQVIRRLQVGRTGRPFGNEFRRRGEDSGILDGDYLQIDLAGNAASLGARVWNVATASALRSALAEAKEEAGVCAIVVQVEKHAFLPPSDAWWDAVPPEKADHEVTRRIRTEYEDARTNQRFYG